MFGYCIFKNKIENSVKIQALNLPFTLCFFPCNAAILTEWLSLKGLLTEW